MRELPYAGRTLLHNTRMEDILRSDSTNLGRHCRGDADSLSTRSEELKDECLSRRVNVDYYPDVSGSHEFPAIAFDGLGEDDA